MRKADCIALNLKTLRRIPICDQRINDDYKFQQNIEFLANLSQIGDCECPKWLQIHGS